MRVAICGKGGVGKTAVTAMLARALAGAGRRVLAFDYDVNPGLERSVGALDRDPRLPAEAVIARDGAQYGHRLRDDLSPTEAVHRYAARGPDGLRVLSFGRITTAWHDLGTTHNALRQVAAGFDADGWDVLFDMEAGTKDVFDRGYVRFVDVLAAITDGSPVAGLACRRAVTIAEEQGEPPATLVLNRATPARRQAAAALATELGVPLVGEIPDDESVRLSDVAGEAVADRAPACAALRAAGEVAAALRAQAAQRAPQPDVPAGASPVETTGGG